MVSWMSNWAQGIIIAIIVGTIIEMILPNGNNKKYVKTVIGVYILFVIVSPVVTALTGDVDFSNLLDYEQYINSSTYQVSNNIAVTNGENIENIYKQKIKEDLEIKLEDKGYILENINMDINLNENSQDYGKIDNLNIEISKKQEVEENTHNSSINKIEKIDIQIGENQIAENENNDNKEKISNEELENLKQYIYENYGIDKKNININ